jgi:hypothetical protein
MRPPYQFTSHLAGLVLSFTDFPPRGGQSLSFPSLITNLATKQLPGVRGL